MKAKIRLDTLKEINRFVSIVSKVEEDVYVSDNNGLKVNAKSMIGMIYAMEFKELWCESEKDIYDSIQDFVI